ncbi:hypothetical protein [Pseudoteredinibacter isoporae]|uniref:Uncharacterized protein n=1 Tax=Pseudoteredinibacter isoporae TaxID=570281 RepID=A0A7X0JTQ6_9GAMM|nr:hypothetical protein [Pseudoteredinibacter isoporae]MBB6522087.1 hypothetical protein [Pseudoteredinibacter isoporae]NHO87622.1 hypothetical protein [Pseudoteredinibacter isoporae]NIB24047.1 hypothetical protein [Pseudoteredinibacter isoporae]
MLKRLSTISLALVAMGLSSQLIAHGYHQQQSKKVYQHAPKVKQFAIKGHKGAKHWRRGRGHQHRPHHHHDHGHSYGHKHGHYHNDHGHRYYVEHAHSYCPTSRYRYSSVYGTYFIVGTGSYTTKVYVHNGQRYNYQPYNHHHYKHKKYKHRPSGKLQVTLGF